jgi:aspartyl-tRNA synthetase
MPHQKHLNDFMQKKNLMHMTAHAYDIVLNGYEIGGGSLRIFNEAVQEKMFEILGMTPEETRAKFGFFLDALKVGTPPHGGIALGFDRIMMILCQTENIKDVIAFPKTLVASCLMSGSPDVPDVKALEELKIQSTINMENRIL